MLYRMWEAWEPSGAGLKSGLHDLFTESGNITSLLSYLRVNVKNKGCFLVYLGIKWHSMCQALNAGSGTYHWAQKWCFSLLLNSWLKRMIQGWKNGEVAEEELKRSGLRRERNKRNTGFFGPRSCSVWYYNGRYMEWYIYSNLQNVQCQEWTLMSNMDSGDDDVSV